ncbi:putative dioxygenase [Minicystis rosea]|nr:putative dioxygenase [Minicystis rosea]
MMKATRIELGRRQMLALLGSTAATIAAGCGSSTNAPGTGGGTTGTGGTAGTGATGTGGVGGSSAAGEWATGGTASMTAKESYPDPFAAGAGTTCALTCAMTLGPCYAHTIERQDISEGHDGLPVRLSFLVVDETCKPISGATVDIWHCGTEGLYSGDDASDFCTSGDETARAARWFRGVQTTDAAGRVNFDTCFPGWYSSRTIHIHFTIRIGDAEYVTSQLFFPDTLDDEIVGTQPLYKDRGARDTTNQTDTVISGDAVNDYTFQYARMSDGAMQAWKTLVIRSSLTDSLCQAPGGSGGMMGGPDGGMMGPPPDGGLPPDGGPPGG